MFCQYNHLHSNRVALSVSSNSIPLPLANAINKFVNLYNSK